MAPEKPDVSGPNDPDGRALAGDRALVALLAIFTVAMLPLVLTLNVWQDETYSLRTSAGNLAFAFRSAIVFEGLPPFYPLLLDCWRVINHSVAFARMLSVGCAAGAIWCAWIVARRALPGIPPIAFAFALAVEPFLIYAALDIRLYALALFLSAAALASFVAGFLCDRPSRSARIAHGVVAVAAMYTQYFMGALLLGCFVALLLSRRWKDVRAYVVLGVAVTVASLPIATFLPEQLSTFRTTSGTTHFSPISVLVTAATFVLPHEWLASWTHGAGNALYWLGFAAIVAAVVAGRPRATPALVAFGTIAFVVVAFFLTVPIALHQTLIVPRHLAVLLVPLLAFAFAVIDALRERRRRGLAVYLAVFTVFAILAFGTTYRSDAKAGDFKHAAAFIQAHERPGQTIYVYDQEMTTPLSYYYRGVNRVVGLPEPQRFDRFDARLFVLHDDADVRSRFARVGPGATIWLYEADICADRTDPFGCRFLEDVVREDYDVVLDRPFFKATVRELVRRGNVPPAK